MSFKGIKQTWKELKDQYKEVEAADKILDAISFIAMVLFIIAIVTIYISKESNPINIALAIYPLALAGVSTAYRMKLIEHSYTSSKKMYIEYVAIQAILIGIVILIIILSLILYP